MARFSSRRADRPRGDDRTQLHYFERFVKNRFEGLNTYSGWMTRGKATSPSRFTKYRLDPLQRDLVTDAVVDAADAMIAARVAAVAMVCGSTRSFERPTGRLKFGLIHCSKCARYRRR